jgi:DNA-binding response OmpR family regulator
MKVVIIEDESIVALEIARFVENEGHEVVATFSEGEKALMYAEKHPVDLAVVDITLEGTIDGITTANRLLSLRRDIQILYLTAHTDDKTIERIAKTEPAGYLAKPFRRKELKAILKITAARCEKKADEGKRITFDDTYVYDMKERSLYHNGSAVHLTLKERMLLELFLQHPNQLIDYYTFENHLWPNDIVTSNSLRSLIKRLRQKLNGKFIKTIPAQGYRFEMARR